MPITLLFLFACRPYHPSGAFVDYKAGRYESALIIAQTDVEKYPFSPESHYIAGKCYTVFEEYKKAYFHFKKTIKLSKNNSSFEKDARRELNSICYLIAIKFEDNNNPDSSSFYYKEAYETLLKLKE